MMADLRDTATKFTVAVSGDPAAADGRTPTASRCEYGEYHPESDTYRVHYEGREVGPGAAVVDAVAAVAGADQSDLPPLQSVVDVDALNALADPTADDPGRGCRRISFSYHDREVTIRTE